MRPRKICVFTGTRADYGLLFWLLRGLEKDNRAQLQLFVSGMHLSDRYGKTVDTIQQDGFSISERVDIELNDDSAVGIAHSVALGVERFANALERLKPDILVVLGDRFEVLAVAEAAMFCRIPIAHIHGGESSEGAIDEAIRHSVSKMSHLHFVSAELHRRRVIQLGESPERVFNVGATGLDNIQNLKLLTRVQLEDSIHFSLGEQFFIVTYHPATLSHEDPVDAQERLLDALDSFPSYKILFTAPNADSNGSRLMDALEDHVKRNAQRAVLVKSLGQVRYLSAVKNAAAVVGNSSSGIIEAPALATPTVNIGDRQRGRLRASSVIDCGEDRDDIINAIKQSLSEPFRSKLGKIESPYGSAGAADKIREKLLETSLEGILFKKFFDEKAI